MSSSDDFAHIISQRFWPHHYDCVGHCGWESPALKVAGWEWRYALLVVQGRDYDDDHSWRCSEILCLLSSLSVILSLSLITILSQAFIVLLMKTEEIRPTPHSNPLISKRMDGWVGHVGWPIADVWPTKWSSVQLAVWRRTGKVRRSKTNVLPLCYAANYCWLCTLSGAGQKWWWWCCSLPMPVYRGICYVTVVCVKADWSCVSIWVGISVEFARALFRIWLQEKDVQNVAAALKRAGLESKLMVKAHFRSFAETCGVYVWQIV